MYTLLSVANYLDEMEEIVVNPSIEYFDENRLKELKQLLLDAVRTSHNWLRNEDEKGFFSLMKEQITLLIARV